MIGAIIGALIGLLILRNFWGVLLGGVIGWGIGAYLRHRRHRVAIGDFMAPLFEILGAMAKADGRVSQPEINLAERLMQRMNLDAEQRRASIEYFNAGKQPGYNPDSAIQRLRQIAATRRGISITLIDTVLEVALADGLNPAKQALLQRLVAGLGVSEWELRALMAMRGFTGTPGGGFTGGYQKHRNYSAPPPGGQPGERDPYTVLGVSRDDDNATIKRAYRTLISQHHPDRMGGLPEHLRRRAAERAGEINAAWDRIKTERGIK